jgi:SAM-dependent methyltransferase
MEKIKAAVAGLRTYGLSALTWRAARLVNPRAGGFRRHRSLFQERKGLEIGGPSKIFADLGEFPVYRLAASVDNCNFSTTTVWEGEIVEGETFAFHHKRKPGRQFVAEATALPQIPSNSYDFVLSSHTIEHTANPLRALQEWRRVLKPQGTLVLVVPDKNWTFDHRRPVTPLAHLIADYENGTKEDDLTHLPEILKLHDLRRDRRAGSYEAFKARSEKNAENRCFHHHVFDRDSAVAMTEVASYRVLSAETLRPNHIIIIATAEGSKAQGSRC